MNFFRNIYRNGGNFIATILLTMLALIFLQFMFVYLNKSASIPRGIWSPIYPITKDQVESFIFYAAIFCVFPPMLVSQAKNAKYWLNVYVFTVYLVVILLSIVWAVISKSML